MTGADLSSNTSSIAGGSGGNGGSGGSSSGQPFNGGNGGSGGSGGVGVDFTASGATLANSGTITGGNGGAGGTGGVAGSGYSAGATGNGGSGGAGVVGSDLTLIDSGSIAGGKANGGTGTQADAITFTSGANTLTLQSGWSLGGDIDVVTGSVTFNQTSAVTLTSSNLIIGSGSVIQNGTGTLHLAGSNTYSGGTIIQAGTLEIASGALAGAGAITFAGTATLHIDAAPNVTFTNTIAGLTPDDKLDLAGMSAATTTAISGSYNSSSNLTVLTVHDTSGGGRTDTFQLSGDYSAATWTVTSDGAGGVTVVDPPLSGPLSVPDGGTASISAAAASAVTFASANGLLELNQSQSFTGTVAGFAGQDQIDFADIGFGTSTTFGYSANSGNTLGVLTVSDGVDTADVTFVGQYSAASFALTSDGNGGVMITVVPQPLTVAAGATVVVSSADSAPVTFAASTGTLQLDDPSAFSGQITGFTGDGTLSGSDQIDLAGIDYNTVQDSFTDGVLTVSDGINTTNLDFVGSYTLANFKLASDGNGGTIVYDPPVTSTANSGNIVGMQIGNGDTHIANLALLSQYAAADFAKMGAGPGSTMISDPAIAVQHQLAQPHA